MKAVIIYYRSDKSYQVIAHNLPDPRADDQASSLWNKGSEAYALDQPVKHRGRPKSCELCRQLAVDYITTQVSFTPAFIPETIVETPLRPEFILGDVGVSQRVETEPDTLDRKIDLAIHLVRRFAPILAALALIVIMILLALGPFARLFDPARNPALASPAVNIPAAGVLSTASPAAPLPPTATATRIPTFTPIPTPTEADTPTPELPTDTPVPACLDATTITLDYVGQDVCIQGPVVRSYYQEPAYYLIFSNDQSSFYIVSYDLKLDLVNPGECVRARGTIQKLQADPIMVLGPKDVLEPCDAP